MSVRYPKFDCATRTIEDATPFEWALLRVIQAGARISAIWGYRGFGACCRLLQKLVPARTLIVTLEKDTAFAFPFADGYWSMLLGGADVYEPEIEDFLRRSADDRYTLIDCGANYGYWSALASGPSFGEQRVIAIEPSSDTFAVLRNNAALNGRRFTCIKSAVGATARSVYLSGNKHEARAVSAISNVAGERVDMLALDSLVDDGTISSTDRIVIKLDVEGQEIAALAGSSRLLAGNCIVISEDHGSDRNHTISRHILEKTSLRLYYYDLESSRFERMTNIATLDRIKRFRNRGYNVFATASPFWEEKLCPQRDTVARPANEGSMSEGRSAKTFIGSLVKGHLLTSL